MTNEERWAQYVVCQKRGHQPSGTPPRAHSRNKSVCRHCGTTYWRTWADRESNAPTKPNRAEAS